MFKTCRLLQAEPLVWSACLLLASALFTVTYAAPGDLQKQDSTLGFNKLSEMSPLAIDAA